MGSYQGERSRKGHVRSRQNNYKLRYAKMGPLGLRGVTS